MKKVILGSALFIGGAIGIASGFIWQGILMVGNKNGDCTNMFIICSIIAFIGIVLSISGIVDKK